MQKRKLVLKFLKSLLLLIFIGIFLWLSRSSHAQDLMHKVQQLFSDTDQIQPGYNAKSLVAIDLSDDEIFIEKNPDDLVTPASLAKLFVIDFAHTIVTPDEIVYPSAQALSLVKEDSSLANIGLKNYSILNLYAAMLVPSGNDAAYVLADYIGGKLNPQANSVDQRMAAFNEALKEYLSDNGYNHTYIYDPSGYDFEGSTNAYDIKKVVEHLLTNNWFRQIVSQSEYMAVLPNGRIQAWKNTNIFLDPAESIYYRPGVKGIKTGSLGADFNLVVLYEKNGKEFLIISLGSQSDTSRYDDVANVLQTIDQSDYLFGK